VRGRPGADILVNNTGLCGPGGVAMFRIFFAAALILAVMLAIKDGRILRDIGLKASCSVTQTSADGMEVEACHPGKWEGLPDMSRVGCTSSGVVGRVGYWTCPAPVFASQVGR